jgi:hypothetical protein
VQPDPAGESLQIVPVSFRQAKAFIREHHRHHKEPAGMVFCLGIATDNGATLVGVATVGRPVARAYQDGYTLEVNRTCTDGSKNANSMLYGAAWRAAKAMGYRRLITYTEASESGSSLRAAGYRVIAEREARPNWAESSRTLRHLRDPDGRGGVQRSLWEAS